MVSFQDYMGDCFNDFFQLVKTTLFKVEQHLHFFCFKMM